MPKDPFPKLPCLIPYSLYGT
ncbi:MAG: hypothetical protein RLZZ268_1096, partial [Cyanobacteriota bacterium]